MEVFWICEENVAYKLKSNYLFLSFLLVLIVCVRNTQLSLLVEIQQFHTPLKINFLNTFLSLRTTNLTLRISDCFKSVKFPA